MKTIRELAEKHPQLYSFNYRWRDSESPQLNKNLSDVLAELGYQLTEEDKDIEGEYNDLRAYLNCNIEPTT